VDDLESDKDDDVAADGDDELSDAENDKVAEAGDGRADSVESLHLHLDTEDVEDTQCKLSCLNLFMVERFPFSGAEDAVCNDSCHNEQLDLQCRVGD